MKLLFIGGTNTKSKMEWFWTFNHLFWELLTKKGFELETPERTGHKNPSGWHKHHLFGHETALNPNNLLIANPKNEKAILFTTLFDLRQVCGGYCDIPRKNMTAIYSGHYDDQIVNRDVGDDLRDKVKPWYFRPWNWESILPENCYNPKDNSIFFRGLLISTVRNLLIPLQDSNVKGMNIRAGKCKDWKELMCQSGLCFSMSGIRDMCNRDIEYWRAGVPFIRPRFTSKLIVDIPDDTYFPVEWEPNYSKCATPIPRDQNKLAEDVIEKYLEIRDNKKLLKQVGDNGYQFYKKHFTAENILKNSFKLLEESGVLD